ncbi:MAG: ATP-binding protein, partial [Spirochaetales bacterium]|nr:ATP-binding protein [Spirochaetales bacterium]
RFIDPFTPNRPIDDPDRFFGREDSVNELADSIHQIMHGNPKHTIITGARGVGKSSLLTQVCPASTGDNRLTDRLGVDRGNRGCSFSSTSWTGSGPIPASPRSSSWSPKGSTGRA